MFEASFSDLITTLGTIGKRTAFAVNMAWYIFSGLSDNKLSFFVSLDGSSSAGSVNTEEIEEDKFYRFSFVYDGSNLKTFIDGVKGTNETSVSGDLFDSIANVIIGGVGGSANNNMNIKEFIIFNRALSDEEILDWANGTTFDYDNHCILNSDMSATNPVDKSGNKNNVIISTFDSDDIVKTEYNGFYGLEAGDHSCTFSAQSIFTNPNEFTVIVSLTPQGIQNYPSYIRYGVVGSDGAMRLARISTDDRSYMRIDTTGAINQGLNMSNGSLINDIENIIIYSLNRGDWIGSTSNGTYDSGTYLHGDGLVPNNNIFMIANLPTERPIYSHISVYNKALTLIQHKDIMNRLESGQLS